MCYTLPIPTKIINLPMRTDRRGHIVNQFKGRTEFNIHVVKAHQHKIGALGLWNTIKQLVKEAADNNDDFLLFCEDDHLFTDHYSIEMLQHNIATAMENEADVLLGGVGWVQSSFAVSSTLFWAETFNATQFTIIFKKFYPRLLEAYLEEDSAADFKMCELSDKVFFIYPFISVQEEFGYSDATMRNNETGRVTDLFDRTTQTLAHLVEVQSFYRQIGHIANGVNEFDIEHITLPTYIINLPHRRDRRLHILQQFAGKAEFDIKIVDACTHAIGAVGLWQSILKVIEMAIENDDDVIVICEDDHVFTSDYSKEYLLRNVIGAHLQNADILMGGIGDGFNHALPVAENRIWINEFYCTQFVVVYCKFFHKILEAAYDDTVRADDFLSTLTNNKMTLYPFISMQHPFGYSDVSAHFNQNANVLPYLFKKAQRRLNKVVSAYNKFHKRDF